MATPLSLYACEEDKEEPFIDMITKDPTPVRRAPNKNTAVIAKIHPDTRIKVRRHSRTSDCKVGWFKRVDWGYICGKHLRRPRESDTLLSQEDAPDIRKGQHAVIITTKKTKVYKVSKRTDRLKQVDEILKGSILSGIPNVDIDGTLYFSTRRGQYVKMNEVESLPSPVHALRIPIKDQIPLAVVKQESATIYKKPSVDADPQGKLSRWEPIFGTDIKEANDAFYRLPDGGYVLKTQISVVNEPIFPKHVDKQERWIAVDLSAQLLYAYEGRNAVQLLPCSTGISDNTTPGRFTILKKIRQQTMRMKMGKMRVEDVQWVMFFDKEEALAIHSAYWHRDFGTRKSHGCVNLPTDDARWLYHWTTPKVGDTDSVTIPLPRNSGTPIIIY